MTMPDPPEGVRFETATVQRILLVLAVVFFSMAIVGIVGEIRGWWNDVGEVLTIVGTLGGLFVGTAALTTGASEAQVATVHEAVVDNGEKLEQLDKLDVIQHELDQQTGVLDRQLAVLEAELSPGFDLWHDRAVFHFLTEPGDRERYVERLEALVSPGGHAIVATFSPDGPDRCSELPVQRYDAQALSDELGEAFRPVDDRREAHETPWGARQSSRYGVFEHRG